MKADWVELLGVTAAVILPLFNFPLVFKMVRRKSSKDLSIVWALGVWTCTVLMTPQAIRSSDLAFRLYGFINLVSFSLVTFFVLKYRD